MKLPEWVTAQAIRTLAVNTIAQLLIAAGTVLGYIEYGPAAICVAAVVGGVLPTAMWFHGMYSWSRALGIMKEVMADRKAAADDRLAAAKTNEAVLQDRIEIKTNLALLEEKKLAIALEMQKLLRLRIDVLEQQKQERRR